jgi:pilus assembly protein Flp/PilA
VVVHARSQEWSLDNWINRKDETRGQAAVHVFVDERGATAIEYGLVAAGIAAAIIAVVLSLGTNLNGTFSGISTQLK